MLNGLLESTHPDIAPPAGQHGGKECGGARTPEGRRPRSFGREAKTRADGKSEDGSQDDQRFHSLLPAVRFSRCFASKWGFEGVFSKTGINGRFRPGTTFRERPAGPPRVFFARR